MTVYNGSTIINVGFGRQDDPAYFVGKVSWDAALTTADTLVFADVLPKGFGLKIDDVEVYGTLPDSNATQTSAIKIGTEIDDDSLQVATVIAQTGQLFLKGVTGVGSTLTGADDIVVTPTADAATPVTSGDLYIKVTGRLQLK